MMKRCELVLGATTRRECKEHPNNLQSPGVCSSCLREKLFELYKTNPIDTLRFSPSPSSPASPQGPGPFSSTHRRRFRRNGSLAAESASCMQSFNLKKSKSLAFASRNRVRERDVNVNVSVNGRKKDGFWSKVLKLKRREGRA